MIAHAICLAPVESAMVRRMIINDGSCMPAVSVSVTPTETISTYAFTEILPFGLTPIHINENGHWHPEKQEIHWGNFRDCTARSFRYDLTGGNGEYQFYESIFSADGTIQTITTTTSVSIQCTQAQQTDSSPPMLDQVDVPFFLADSKTVPTYLSITCTTPDAVIFFTTDGSRPTTASHQYTKTMYIAHPAIIRAFAMKSGIQQSSSQGIHLLTPQIKTFEAKRKIINNDSCAPSIIIHVTPAEHTQTYAIIENLPNGLTPCNINENGEYHIENQTIRWGNFRDNISRSFSYRLTACNGAYTLCHMNYSADGLTYDITQNTMVTLNCPLNHDNEVVVPEIVSTPTFHTNSKSEALLVSITCETTDTIIYYTTDGSRPTKDDFVYSNPIALSDRSQIRAIAIKDGMISSTNALFDHSITPTTKGFGDVSIRIDNNQSCYPIVYVSAIPSENILTYAVEILIPNNLNILSISDGGHHYYTQNSIRWGNFRDHASRTFSFRIQGENQQAEIIGGVSFDGYSQEISAMPAEIACDTYPEQTIPVVTNISNDPDPVKRKIWQWSSNTNCTFRFAIDQNPSWLPVGNFENITKASIESLTGKWYLHVQAKDTSGIFSDVITVSAILENTGPLIPATERQALIDLYNSTGGDQWRIKNGWLEQPQYINNIRQPNIIPNYCRLMIRIL